jgi:hypothetical protein
VLSLWELLVPLATLLRYDFTFIARALCVLQDSSGTVARLQNSSALYASVAQELAGLPCVYLRKTGQCQRGAKGVPFRT